ncbi:MAG: hydantoinase/oxoprolinase family protein [Alphaproteobacteria bacterium]
MTAYRLGVDIGGTFTDIVLLGDDGALYSKKVLSTPDDYSRAIQEGTAALLAETGIPVTAIREVGHGTTVATNAIIERKGVKVALVTTKGFRDVLEIGRFRAPRLYDLDFRKPEPLVERRLRMEVPERIMASGEVFLPLDEAECAAVGKRCAELGVDAIAVCFINAYANPAHEERAAEILRANAPGVPVTISTELVPQVQEYERTSTVVVNAYIRPVIERYVESLLRRLGDLGLKVSLNIMQSNGGVLPALGAARNPVYIIESGPAAGVVGAQRMGSRIGADSMLVFDMGGTTAKAAIIEGGRFGLSPETEVGGGAALGHRMIRGGGYVVQVPTIDIAEVGAGGGSIAWVDAGGAVQVGPRSAGAAPGPVCYDRGGMDPTVTDANLLLGYLNQEYLVGGELKVNRPKAEAQMIALAERVGQKQTDLAYGIHLIANATMMRALSAVSSERGLDPADFTLVGFGGNGGVHVCGLAESLRISKIVVPPVAGLFCALGLLFADMEHQPIRAFYRRLDSLKLEELNAALQGLVDEAARLLEADGFKGAGRQTISLSAEVKYVGQNSSLTVPFKGPKLDAAGLADFAERFAQLHNHTFGYRSDKETLQIVSIKAVGRGIDETPRVPERARRAMEKVPAASRRTAYFGSEHGWLDTPVVPRSGLAGKTEQGPLIVEEYDTTIVVRPGWSARLDDWNNVVLERQ